MEKAARHLEDAMYLRRVRHDIDVTKNKLLKFCYNLQTSPKWQTFLYMLSWIFMFLAIFEPAHSAQNYFFDENPGYKTVCIVVETIIICVFIFEAFMDVYHRKFDKNRTFREKYIKNFKMTTKIFFLFLFVLDFIVFYARLPTATFRFSRPARPFCLALYQK